MCKKISMFLLCLSFVFFGAGSLFAATTVTDGSSIGGTNDPGPGIELSLSPSVTISYNGATDSYGMGSFNSKGAIAYGASSASNAVYQQSATAVVDVTADEDMEAADSDWTPVGGS